MTLEQRADQIEALRAELHALGPSVQAPTAPYSLAAARAQKLERRLRALYREFYEAWKRA